MASTSTALVMWDLVVVYLFHTRVELITPAFLAVPLALFAATPWRSSSRSGLDLPCIFARFWQRSAPLASTSTTATGGAGGNHLDHPLIARLKSLPCILGQPLARRRGQLSNHTVAHARHTPPRPWRQLVGISINILHCLGDAMVMG